MNLTEHPTELNAGTVLHDNYEILATLKSGGMGRVYKAKHVHLGTVCAIKQTFFSNPSERHWFENEAKTLNKLSHEGLPKVTDYFCIKNNCYLVMDLIEGRDLKEILDQEGCVHPGNLIPWAIQILKVLCYLHSKEANRDPVIHRDIKPHNIKVDNDNRVFLLDFGIAKTGTQTLIPGLGTPAYSPLEQIRELGTDARSDLFSLGATLYELLTGELPENAYKRQYSIVGKQNDPLKPITFLKPEIASGLAKVIEKALSIEPADRFSSARDMLNLLEEETAEAYVRRGAHYVKEHQYDQALDALSQALLLDDKTPELYFWRAQAYAAKGESDLAIIDWTKELELNSRNASVHKYRGNQYLELSNFGLALADFNSALKLDPQNASLHFCKGVTYKKLGNSEQAIIEFRRAVELSPRESDTHKQSVLELQRLESTGRRPDDPALPKRANYSFSQGAIALLMASAIVIAVWSFICTYLTSSVSERTIYQTVFVICLGLIGVLGFVLRFGKSVVQFVVPTLILLIGTVFLIDQWTAAQQRTQELEQKAGDAEQLAKRLIDGLVIEEARRTGKEAWQVSILENLADGPITYDVFIENQTWQTRTLQPHQSEPLWRKGDVSIKFNSGREVKQYNLDTSPVMDREPDQSEKARAPVNYFLRTAEGLVELYSRRPGRPK